MKIRAQLHLGETSRALQLFSILQETAEHLLLKLAASVFFHVHDPLIMQSAQQHAALSGQEYAPDLMTVDDSQQVTLWIECGKTTLHKLDKVSKRFRGARLVMLLAQPHEAEQMGNALESESIDRYELYSFRSGEFQRWAKLVQEQTVIVGEATETSMNLVINDAVYMTELQRWGVSAP